LTCGQCSLCTAGKIRLQIVRPEARSSSTGGPAMTDLPDQFYTWPTLGTLAGASGATFIITNTLRSALDWSPKWLGLVVAQAICIGGGAVLGKQASDSVIAILNGCLVYLSAVGVASATAGVAPTVVARGDAVRPPSHRFLSSWF